jgi:glycerophosphoryl diester phosphodiesterase
MPLAAPSHASGDTTRVPDGFDLQGHRGARGLAPENTIPAFRRALELGVTTLEMDVAVSQDNRVVVSHEPWMNPAICTKPDGTPIEDGRAHNLYRMPYAEIKQYDCGQRRHPDFPEQTPTPAPKPLLADVIAMAEAYGASHDRPPVFYNIEIKSRPEGDGTFHPEPTAFAREVIRVVRAHDVAARTTIQSFDPRALRATRTLEADRDDGGSVRLALLVADGWWVDGLADQIEALGFTPDIYSPDYSLVDAALVDRVHARGMQLVPWTVNDRSAMRRLIEAGVDGLITDYPNRAVEVLRAREDTP